MAAPRVFIVSSLFSFRFCPKPYRCFSMLHRYKGRAPTLAVKGVLEGRLVPILPRPQKERVGGEGLMMRG